MTHLVARDGSTYDVQPYPHQQALLDTFFHVLGDRTPVLMSALSRGIYKDGGEGDGGRALTVAELVAMHDRGYLMQVKRSLMQFGVHLPQRSGLTMFAAMLITQYARRMPDVEVWYLASSVPDCLFPSNVTVFTSFKEMIYYAGKRPHLVVLDQSDCTVTTGGLTQVFERLEISLNSFLVTLNS